MCEWKWALLPLYSLFYWPLTLIFIAFTNLSTSNQSQSQDRSKLLSLRDWNHHAFDVQNIPPLLCNFDVMPKCVDITGVFFLLWWYFISTFSEFKCDRREIKIKLKISQLLSPSLHLDEVKEQWLILLYFYFFFLGKISIGLIHLHTSQKLIP